MHLLYNAMHTIKKIFNWYKKVYGDRFYLEMQDHGHPKSSTHSAEQKKINDWHMAHAKELGIPLYDRRQRSDMVEMAVRNNDIRETVIVFDTYRNIDPAQRYKRIEQNAARLTDHLYRCCPVPYQFHTEFWTSLYFVYNITNFHKTL